MFHANKCFCQKTLTVGTAAAQGDGSTPQVQLLLDSVSEASVEGAHSSALKGEHYNFCGLSCLPWSEKNLRLYFYRDGNFFRIDRTAAGMV